MSKKSREVVLGTVFFMAIQSCGNKNEWISGEENGRVRDTTLHSNSYRYYGGYWYPIYNNRISPSTYQGSSISQIALPGYVPARVIRVKSGGFGSSSHSIPG
jgi:hypothetical protein